MPLPSICRMRLIESVIEINSIDYRPTYKRKLSTIFATVAATLTFRYSSGAVQAPPAAASFIASTIRSGSEPDRILLPHSVVSGRSVTSRMVTLGMPKMHAFS